MKNMRMIFVEKVYVGIESEPVRCCERKVKSWENFERVFIKERERERGC